MESGASNTAPESPAPECGSSNPGGSPSNAGSVTRDTSDAMQHLRCLTEVVGKLSRSLASSGELGETNKKCISDIKASLSCIEQNLSVQRDVSVKDGDASCIIDETATRKDVQDILFSESPSGQSAQDAAKLLRQKLSALPLGIRFLAVPLQNRYNDVPLARKGFVEFRDRELRLQLLISNATDAKWGIFVAKISRNAWESDYDWDRMSIDSGWEPPSEIDLKKKVTIEDTFSQDGAEVDEGAIKAIGACLGWYPVTNDEGETGDGCILHGKEDCIEDMWRGSRDHGFKAYLLVFYDKINVIESLYDRHRQFEPVLSFAESTSEACVREKYLCRIFDLIKAKEFSSSWTSPIPELLSATAKGLHEHLCHDVLDYIVELPSDKRLNLKWTLCKGLGKVVKAFGWLSFGTKIISLLDRDKKDFASKHLCGRSNLIDSIREIDGVPSSLCEDICNEFLSLLKTNPVSAMDTFSTINLFFKAADADMLRQLRTWAMCASDQELRKIADQIPSTEHFKDESRHEALDLALDIVIRSLECTGFSEENKSRGPSGEARLIVPSRTLHLLLSFADSDRIDRLIKWADGVNKQNFIGMMKALPDESCISRARFPEAAERFSRHIKKGAMRKEAERFLDELFGLPSSLQSDDYCIRSRCEDYVSKRKVSLIFEYGCPAMLGRLLSWVETLDPSGLERVIVSLPDNDTMASFENCENVLNTAIDILQRWLDHLSQPEPQFSWSMPQAKPTWKIPGGYRPSQEMRDAHKNAVDQMARFLQSDKPVACVVVGRNIHYAKDVASAVSGTGRPNGTVLQLGYSVEAEALGSGPDARVKLVKTRTLYEAKLAAHKEMVLQKGEIIERICSLKKLNSPDVLSVEASGTKRPKEETNESSRDAKRICMHAASL